MGGHWRTNAQPVGGAGRGYKPDLSLLALKLIAETQKNAFCSPKDNRWLAISKDITLMILLNVKQISE